MSDATAPVRSGEELPVPRLEAYLRQKMPELSGPLVVEQFPHGHSNLTYLLRSADKELVLRRAPLGNQVKGAHDMGREFRVLSKLWSVYPPAPRPYLYCDDASVLDAPFYLMERRHGIVLRKTSPVGVTIDVETARRLGVALIDNLATLHSLDYQAAGLGDLGRPVGYVARQVSGWIERYANSQTEDVAAMGRLSQWLQEQMPKEAGAALVHNDYKYDNLLLDAADPRRILAVLDWEMATVGDPLMDLGTTLAYWVEANDPPALRATATGPTYLPGSLTRAQLIERYAARSGCAIDSGVYYYSFGLYKIAVIIQQIYARYVRGHTQDARFARLIEVVRVLADQADRTVLAGKL
jgi:aminoglycoside phosphotransferase (APT) family kinase protein